MLEGSDNYIPSALGGKGNQKSGDPEFDDFDDVD